MRSRSPNIPKRRFDRIRPLGPRPRKSPRERKSPKLVLMTRPEAISPEVTARLKARGRGALVQPLLHTRPLPAEIPSPENFQAVLAGSIAAVRILAERTQDRSCKFYVVGKATARAAKKAGYRDIRFALSANDLAVVIRADLDPNDGSLLYVAGRHRARDFRRLLSAFKLELVEVYSAEKTRTLRPAVCKALKRGLVSDVTFYSGRAVDAFMVAARRGDVANEARQTTALCLSPRIAARAQAHGWRRTWAARHPVANLIDARLMGIRANESQAARNSDPFQVDLPVNASSNAAPPNPSHPPSPSQTAVPEAPMTTPAPTPPTPDGTADNGRSDPGWPAVIGVAVIAAIFAGVVWYLGNDRASELQAEVSNLRDRVAAIDLDPGKADRAALAARAEEAAKVATALSGVAEKAAEKASVDNLALRVDALSEKSDAAIAALRTKTEDASRDLQASIEGLKSQSETQTRSVQELSNQVAALQNRLAAIEEWTKGPSPALLADQLVALSELRQVLDKGTPFAAALDRAERALPRVTTTSNGWQDRAAIGIPTYAELAADLTKIERRLPPPQSDSSGNAVVDSALGVLLSGIQVEGKGALVDDPNRKVIAVARTALANDNPEGARKAIAAVAGNVKALDDWRAELAARMAAEAAISDWEEQVLTTVGGSVK